MELFLEPKGIQVFLQFLLGIIRNIITGPYVLLPDFSVPDSWWQVFLVQGVLAQEFSVPAFYVQDRAWLTSKGQHQPGCIGQ
jgi:hypothetical protein